MIPFAWQLHDFEDPNFPHDELLTPTKQHSTVGRVDALVGSLHLPGKQSKHYLGGATEHLGGAEEHLGGAAEPVVNLWTKLGPVILSFIRDWTQGGDQILWVIGLSNYRLFINLN